MYEVYVIKSVVKNWYYVGLTSDKQRRIKQHNDSQVKSTKAYAPLKLIFSKTFSTRKDARDFEKYLKIRSNKEKLLRSLKLF